MTANSLDQLELLRRLNSSDFLSIAVALVLGWLFAALVRRVLRWVSETLPSQMRLPTLRIIPQKNSLGERITKLKPTCTKAGSSLNL